MKVILEAFGGALQSEVMNWPEGQGPSIRMVMDMPGLGTNSFVFKQPAYDSIRTRLAEFEYDYQRADGITIYKLVNVN